MFKFIIFILASLMSASCSSSISIESRLHDAESLMDEHPDSALAIIQTVNPEDITSARTKALYALLYVQAQIKNYIPVKNDSIIIEAVNYFNRTSDRQYKMLSNFYLGDICYERQDHTEAIIHFFTSYELAKELDNKFWIGMSARGIADVYHDNYCAVEELEFTKIELSNFRQTHESRFINHAINDLARAYQCNESYDEAIRLSKQLLDSAKVYNDTILRDKSLNNLGLSYLAIENYNEAYNCFRSLCSSTYATATDSSYLCGMLFHLGHTSEAKAMSELLVKSNDIPPTIKHWLTYQLYAALDSPRQALKMMTAISSDNDKALKKARRQNIAGSLHKHLDHKSSLASANLRYSKLQTIIAIAFGAIAISLIAFFSHRKYLRQQEIIEEYMTMAKDLENLLRQQDDGIQEKTATFHQNGLSVGQTSLSLLQKHLKEFDTLCKNFRRENTNDSRKIIAECVGNIIDIFISDPQRIDELEHYVNYRYNNIMSDLRVDFPKLKEDDYMIFLFSRLGFSIATIAILMRKENNKTAIYNRRKRMKEKFREFHGENRDFYLDAMG